MSTDYEQAKAAMESEMKRLKGYFPYRIVWGAINPETLEKATGASPTRRQLNDHVRKGWHGFTL